MSSPRYCNDHSWVEPAPREELIRLYVDEIMTQQEVAEYLGVTPKRVETAMRRFGIPRRKSTSRNQKGSANPRWKGSEASYSAKHLRVSQSRGRPSSCEVCGTDDPGLKYEWANLTGDLDDPADYQRMCKGCHGRFDAATRVNLNRVRALVALCEELLPQLSAGDRDAMAAAVSNVVLPMRPHTPRRSRTKRPSGGA